MADSDQKRLSQYSFRKMAYLTAFMFCSEVFTPRSASAIVASPVLQNVVNAIMSIHKQVDDSVIPPAPPCDPNGSEGILRQSVFNQAMGLCHSPLSAVDSLIGSDAFPTRLMQFCSDCSINGLLSIVRRYHDQARINVPVSRSGRRPSDPVWEIRASESLPLPTERCLLQEMHLEQAGNHLDFFGSRHIYTIEDPIQKDRLLQILRERFQRERPDAVIMEGVPDGPLTCDNAVRFYLDARQSMTSEQTYLARLALMNGTPVAGAEPPNLGLIPPSDEGLLYLSAIAQMHSSNQNASLSEIFTSAAQMLRQFSIGNPQIQNPSDFSLWYRNFNRREFNLETAYTDMTPSDQLPTRYASLPSNEAFLAATLRRNNFLLNQIRNSVGGGRRTMVIYGEGHLRATATAIQRGMRITAALPLNCTPMP